METNEKYFVWSFIFESDLIEQIENNRQKLRDDIIAEKQDGHVGAFLFARSKADREEVIDEDFVKTIQLLICTEQHLKGAKKLEAKHLGKYRRKNISVISDRIIYMDEHITLRDRKTIRKGPSPKDIQILMKKWIGCVQKWQKKCQFLTPEKNVEKIADFHFNFEQIHPFADGNGRTGRILAYYMLRYAKLNECVFLEHEKSSDYYPSFKNRKLMREYFRLRVFEPEKILGRIETVDESDIIQF